MTRKPGASCECRLSPGRLEGESALVFLADYLGEPDDQVGRYGFYALPLEPDEDADHAASLHGYCRVCIQHARAESSSVGLLVYTDDNGFVYGTKLQTFEEWDRAVSAAEEEEQDNQDD